MDGQTLEGKVFLYVKGLGAANYSLIARQLGLHNCTVRDVVKELERKNLVNVISTKKDSGTKIVVATKEGDFK